MLSCSPVFKQALCDFPFLKTGNPRARSLQAMQDFGKYLELQLEHLNFGQKDLNFIHMQGPNQGI
jgi:hypothetical protein